MILFILLNIVSLIRTLIIFAIIYYGIKIFIRIVLPSMVQKGVKNMQQKMYDQYRHENHQSRNEGDVTVENLRHKDRNSNPNKGEYVDFEEID